MAREELVEQAVFGLAEQLGLLDVVGGEWARRRLRARRGAEAVVGRDHLAQRNLGRRTTLVVVGESTEVACWPGYATVEVRVARPCASARSGGVLGCVSHNRRLPHSADIERHTAGNDEHLLGWLCPDHGLEAPSAD